MAHVHRKYVHVWVYNMLYMKVHVYHMLESVLLFSDQTEKSFYKIKRKIVTTITLNCVCSIIKRMILHRLSRGSHTCAMMPWLGLESRPHVFNMWSGNENWSDDVFVHSNVHHNHVHHSQMYILHVHHTNHVNVHYNQRCYRYQVNNKIIIAYIIYQKK